jgi:hypothetical protein
LLATPLFAFENTGERSAYQHAATMQREAPEDNHIPANVSEETADDQAVTCENSDCEKK